MAENIKELNIIQRLAKIRGIADVVQKSLKGFNYSYTDISEILAKVTAGMNKYNVSLIPSIVGQTSNIELKTVVNTKVDKTGRTYDNTTSEYLFSADMVFRWVCDDNPEDFIDVPWFVAGAQSDPSQACGSGLTYITRYFLTNYFQIAQNNDVDGYRSKQKAAEVAEEKAIAEGIIQQVDTLVKTFLSDNMDKADDVKKFMTRYAKNANYLSIKDPALAAKLLEDFKNTYIGENK